MPRAIEEPRLKPLSCDDLIPGDTYEIKLYIVAAEDDCKVSENNKWELANEAQFVIQQEHFMALKDGLAVIPLDVARDALRNKFLKR